MSALRLHWCLSTPDESRGRVRPAAATHSAGPTFGHLAAARTAERVGFDGVHLPIATWGDEGWLAVADLLAETDRLKVLVGFRPGRVDPVHAAQLTALYQRISNGRMTLEVLTDHEPARSDEFLAVLRGVWSHSPFDFAGAHYRVEAAQVRHGVDPVPALYVDASAGPAARVAARHADVCLTSGAPEQVSEQVERIRSLAGDREPTLRFGLRAFTLSRDTSSQARRDARRLLRGRARGGTVAALVGSHEEVADRIEDYHRRGIDELVLSGHPHVEEVHSFGAGVLPVLARRGLLAGPGGERFVARSA
jgi:alkanesulfonate monooxygenase